MNDRWQQDVLGSSLCSMKVGGVVKWVSKPASTTDLEVAIREAGEQGMPYRILGAGSNVVLPDAGFEGLIIIPSSRSLEVLEGISFTETPLPTINERYRKETGKGFLELEKQEIETGEPVWVRVGAGVPWGQLVMWSLDHGLLGLQGFARIPCAVGGAVYNNIHGEKHFFSETIQEVLSYTPDGWVKRLPSQLDFGYDHSVFHEHPDEVIWEVVLRLHRGTSEVVQAAKEQYLAWTRAKTEKQPSGANSGSVFQNLSPEEPAAKESGMVAAGWYVDHGGCLGWEEGPMQVYPSHGNFIINNGGGTQVEFIRLVERVRERVHEQYGVWLLPEVLCILANGSDMKWPAN